MSEEVNGRIAEARERVERGQRVRAELAPSRERLSERAVQARRLEACLNEVEQQLAALTSFSLTGLVESLMGGKQRKIDERRTELTELEGQFGESQSVLELSEQEVATLEQELAQLDGAEKELEAACEEKARVILERADATAQIIARLSAELAEARETVRRTQKAEETGRQLLKHMESLERAVRNAKSNLQLTGRPLGAVGHLVSNAIASMGPKSTIRLVVDALERFLRDTGELLLSDHPDDVDLMRIRAELEVFAGQLAGVADWKDVATLAVRQDVQTGLSHLKAKATDARTLATGLQTRRMEWIEGA